MKSLINSIAILGTTVFLISSLNRVYAQASSSDKVSATIKISVCGNAIVEGSEDCEGVDLNGQTCESLGFGPGTLTCDIACSFDISNCSPAPTSTPTPSPTPTSTPAPTSTPTPTPTPGPNPTSAPQEVVNPTSAPQTVIMSTPAVKETSTARPLLPQIFNAVPAVVVTFDTDGDGKITAPEIFASVKAWVDEWKQIFQQETSAFAQEKNLSGATPRLTPTANSPKKCDINKDQTCDLFDLSILLYYIGR